MTNSKAINVLAAVTTVAAWYGLYLFLHPHPPKIDLRPHEALGEVLAAEALRLLDPGARFIVIARDPVPFQVPASAAQLDSFLRTIEKSGKSVTAFRRIKLDPLRLAAVPPGDFYDLIRQGRDNDVLVSFLGPPVLDEPQLAKLGHKRPHILAVCSGAMPAQVNLKRIFEQQLLAVAVISRDNAPAHLASGGKHGAFERMFKLITPGNLSELQPAAVARN